MKANQAKEFEKNDYGVFLNADASSLERFKMYETIVIDAQYFTKRDIELLHQNGTVVYTYLNIGSIENFREYYTTYAELAIGEYEHWEEEECAGRSGGTIRHSILISKILRAPLMIISSKVIFSTVPPRLG